jgi:hypothetical protein
MPAGCMVVNACMVHRGRCLHGGKSRVKLFSEYVQGHKNLQKTRKTRVQVGGEVENQMGFNMQVLFHLSGGPEHEVLDSICHRPVCIRYQCTIF